MELSDLESTKIMFAVVKISMVGQIDGNLTVVGIYPTRKIANKRRDHLKKYTSSSRYYVRNTQVWEPRKEE